ncbi:MAG: F0F1 ATP synthase subunit delta [Dehalococcoidia bacterium]
MITDPAAKRYAQAAFELARDRGELDAWERDLTSLREVLASREALAFVSSRTIPREAKEDLIRRTAGDLSPLVWNLVRLLNQRGRLELLLQIVERFQELLDEERGIEHVQVLTAVEMSPDERDALRKRLSDMTGKQVEMQAFVEPEILGGLVVRVGDRLIDGSTKSKLLTLKRQLAGQTR